jgi:hypothetical protein
MVTLQRLPVARIERTEISSKIVFNEGPALTWLGAGDDAGARLFLHCDRMQVEELRRLLEIQRFH